MIVSEGGAGPGDFVYIAIMANAKTELLIQADLVTGARLVAAGIHPDYLFALPELAYLFSSLNGVRLRPRQAVEQQAAGMLAGVPDLCLPVGRGGYLSFYVEMKAPGGTVSKAQKLVHNFLRSEGNRVGVYFNAADALRDLVEYCLGAPTFARREMG